MVARVGALPPQQADVYLMIKIPLTKWFFKITAPPEEGEQSGFTATRQCDHPGCDAQSPECPETWKFWRLNEMATITARDAGWQRWWLCGLDFCPRHVTSILTAEEYAD